MHILQEWFSNRITEFANDLGKPITITNGLAINSTSDIIKVLTNLALDFDEIADTCLLVLHLEVIYT